MIFVTVGSDIPFDRLIKAVDLWARKRNRQDVFAQVGRNGWDPEFITSAQILEPREFAERLAASSIVIGHAGMGTVLSALQHSKPIIVMPRRGHLGETRNDHQMATASHLHAMGRVNVAYDEFELCERLDHHEQLVSLEPIAAYANPELTRNLRDFIYQREAEGIGSH